MPVLTVNDGKLMEGKTHFADVFHDWLLPSACKYLVQCSPYSNNGYRSPPRVQINASEGEITEQVFSWMLIYANANKIKQVLFVAVAL